jgi:hypothetical protein
MTLALTLGVALHELVDDMFIWSPEIVSTVCEPIWNDIWEVVGV